eukprot:741965-Amphidinium_carterae.1
MVRKSWPVLGGHPRLAERNLVDGTCEFDASEDLLCACVEFAASVGATHARAALAAELSCQSQTVSEGEDEDELSKTLHAALCSELKSKISIHDIQLWRERCACNAETWLEADSHLGTDRAARVTQQQVRLRYGCFGALSM